MIAARSLGVTGVLLVLAACGGTEPSEVSIRRSVVPTATARVTAEPSVSVDPNFTPQATPTAIETTEPAKKKKKKEASPSPETESSPATESSADKWEGTEFETAYDTEFAICKSFGVKAVAKEYGVPANPIDAAQAVSEGYQPAFQQAAFEGCLDGFNAR